LQLLISSTQIDAMMRK